MNNAPWPFPIGTPPMEEEKYPEDDYIGRINQWNVDAGRTECEFNVRNTALYTGLQCEELAEKLTACGLYGIAGHLDQVADELKQGFWDKAIEGADRTDMLDADADLVVVTVGSAQAIGSDFKNALCAVIDANDAKRFPDGTLHKDANGKILKPAGWTAPDLSDYLY